MAVSILGIYALMVLASYLVGSFPTGYVVGRLHGIDVRHYGSGKTGGTNVLRTLGWGAMIAVVLADVIKGLIVAVLAQQFSGSPMVVVLCGLGVIGGHNWPVYIRFKGGSGVGTGLGVLIGIVPLVAAGLFLIFLIPVAVTRYMSLGSIAAAACAPIVLFSLFAAGQLPLEYALFGLVGATLVLWRHRGNMSRLLAGTERKVGERVEVKRGD